MTTLHERMREVKRNIILQTLVECGCNQTRAAQELGIHRNRLNDVLKELGVDIKQLKQLCKDGGIMSDLKSEEEAYRDKIARYTNSYCRGRVSGGALGERMCGNRIAIGESLCEQCKSKKELARLSQQAPTAPKR